MKNSLSRHRGKRGSSPFIIGITGSFGSGKTTVAGMFRSKGVKVIDADRIARNLLKRGNRIYKKIVSSFGEGILKNDKSIDKSFLGEKVFSNKVSLRKINRIMHPEIIRIIKKDIKDVNTGGVLVLDAPLLIEAGLKDIVSVLVVVKCRLATQIKRLKMRTHLTEKEIRLRIRSQMPLKEKIRLADFVIDNDGTIEKTKKQVSQIRRLLCRK